MNKQIEVEVSARHIHLSKKDFELIFGVDASFENVVELSQSGEFATDKKIEIIGEKSRVEARFLSPFREHTQVELAATDIVNIGAKAKYSIISESDGEEITIKGPAGEITRNALIVAKRHVHANPIEAKELNLSDGQNVSVKIKTLRGEVLFSDVEVKIANNFHLRLHLDTDEGNAAGISGKTMGEIIL